MHLCGNIRQYAISSLGETEDVRVRDKEFSTKEGFNKNELSAKLKNTVDEAINIIENLDESRLIKLYSVQGFNLSGIGIIIHNLLNITLPYRPNCFLGKTIKK